MQGNSTKTVQKTAQIFFEKQENSQFLQFLSHSEETP